MVTKKLKITTDILRLIKGLKIETFEMGSIFDTNRIVDTIAMIESSAANMMEFGELRDELVRIKGQIGLISDYNEQYAWGVNQWSFWGGTYAIEDIALNIGCFDKYIQGTEEDPNGKEYPLELENYMWGLYDFFSNNMEYIIDLVFSMVDNGGLTPGEYIYKNGVWTKSKTQLFKDDTWENYLIEKSEKEEISEEKTKKSFFKRIFGV